MKKLLFLALGLIITQSMFAQKIDTKLSKVEFEVMNMGNLVGGTILNIKGMVNLEESNLDAANFSATADVQTIKTDNGGRDKHLQKDDFFGATKFPEVKLESKSIAKTDAGYEAVATLTIRDISMEVKIPFTLTTEEGKKTLNGTFKVTRKDFKLGEKIDEGSVGLEVAVKIHCVLE